MDEPDVVVLGRRLVVAEDQGDVDVPGPQQLESLWGVGVDDAQLEARIIATQDRGGGGDERAQHGGKPGQANPAATETDVR